VPVPVGAGERTASRPVEASKTGEYRVRAGDTMSKIAGAHGVSVAWLAQQNHISSRGKIYPGQILKVPGGSTASVSGSTQAPASATYVDYRVKSGENLTEIAGRYGMSAQRLAQINNISVRGRIYPGQTLRVPSVARSGGKVTYTVRRGDNLSKIAREFGIAVSELIEFNGIDNPEHIPVGTTLTIPTPR